MKDRNNFRKCGDIRVRYETPEERREILRILEEKLGFRIDEDQKRITQIHSMSTRTFDINLKRKTIQYGVQPFIGAAMLSSGIRFYSAQEFFRISELGFKTVPRFPVFHVPHDGMKFPEDLLSSVCVTGDVFRDYHERMRDKNIRELIPRVYRGGQMICAFDISRLLCDVERFIGPEEIMERYGMGFCYEKAYDGTVIRNGTDEARKLTRRYYDEHHRRMDALCERHPRMLLFDMHSYWDGLVPEDFLSRERDTPDLCIGTDGKYTPPELLNIVNQRFSEAGFQTAVNYPYSGFFVPDCMMNGSADCDLAGIMLEFHRRTYLNEAGESDPEKTERICGILRQIPADCAEL